MDFMKAKALATEQRIYVKGELAFTGQPDLVAEISGLTWLIDIKPTYRTWHRLQLAAYGLLLIGEFKPAQVWAVLPLDSSKHPKPLICSHFGNGDVAEWDRCLKSWYWRYRAGLIKVEK
jgi:hypothetical protein